MKNTKKVLGLSLVFALGFSITPAISQKVFHNVSYASQESKSFRNTLENEINKDAEFRMREEFKKANEAKIKIYEVSLNYGKELLEREDASEIEFKTVVEELRNAKASINDTSNPMEEESKDRVKLRLAMIPAKDLLLKVPRRDYNKKEYDELSAAYGKASLVYESMNPSKYDLLIAQSRLESASKNFERTNNAKARKIRLQQAYDANKLQADAARNLLENYPKTVEGVKDKLVELLKTAEKLQKQAEAALAKL